MNEKFREALGKAMAVARENVKYSLEHNSDDKYWAAQGEVAAYRHVLLMLDAAATPEQGAEPPAICPHCGIPSDAPIGTLGPPNWAETAELDTLINASKEQK